MNVAPSGTYEAVVDWGVSGATLGLTVIDNAGGTAVARLTSSISEFPSGSGIYQRTGNTAPSTAGQYTIVWDDGASYAIEDLLVTTDTTAVAATATATMYVSSSALHATLSLSGQTYADADITAAISAASRAIDNETGRRFYLDTDATSIRYYTPSSSYGILCIDDIVGTPTIALDLSGGTTYGTALTLHTHYELEPYNASLDSKPYTELRLNPQSGQYWPYYPRSVRVTGQFGWPNVPGPIVDATSILASRFLKRKREAPFGIVTAGIDAGAIMRISRTDPDVWYLIEPYSRRTLIV